MNQESYAPYCDRLQRLNIAKNRPRYDRGKGHGQAGRSIRSAFLVSASLGLYRQWVRDGKALSLERLTELGCKLISEGYKSI